MGLEKLQRWWEIPAIAHFCCLFAEAFNLNDFDIEELEAALIAEVCACACVCVRAKCMTYYDM